ncbi:toll/interleukin-1 receptor domain-containing protein [Vibrio sp. Vb5031]|uniref:toll/interleukin-1 receptor domain-containing protein n=1 Tax=Vibrio sp. Vb5031 TaxID=3074699 RepID=UPI001A219B7B|nr:toll/interleukin-1 receptor domain-containing protein [Vibrio sp. Vb5031]MCR9676043.1 toll/interleukin-1 receptor domain-containing protein [Vibrio alginolyticus]HAS3028640.1 hypothetical protein [Vibrio parahaemolyticus]MDW1502536.1 toll/interleukin-1 receptor domain-containing protein [Vibrio sp. Vb5031]HAS3033917.1 hypothetical protein [Vibrio parahaemolyticus]HAS3039500.1 hypothetical protein [Vibrio parahaemolyticus]
MYKSYDLDFPNIEDYFDTLIEMIGDEYVHSFEVDFENKKKHIEKSLHDFYLGNGDLDATALKEAWFPEIENTHIFLSHSHKDKELAVKIAVILKYILNINVFIDSCVWGYADDLLREIDNKYALNINTNTYSYEVRNRTTSNIYLILQSSLMTMIDSAECLFFLNTDNTVTSLKDQTKVETRTSSPWIMSELQFSSIARRRQSQYANRKNEMQLVNKAQGVANDMKFQVSHKLPTDHLKKLSPSDWHFWVESSINKNIKGYDALTLLYESFN